MNCLKLSVKRTIRFFRKILGLQVYNNLYQHYFDTENMISGMILASLVAFVSLLLLGHTLITMDSETKALPFWQTPGTFLPYAVLFSASAVLFIFNYRESSGHRLKRYFGKIMMLCFAGSVLSSGIYISYFDYIQHGRLLVFIAMEVFIFGIMIWRPVVSVSLITASFLVFHYLCSAKLFLASIDKVHFFTVWLSIVAVNITRYYKKILDIKRAQHLEDINTYLSDLSVTDEATGIGNMLSFRTKVDSIRNNDKEEFLSRIFLFLDIRNFSSYNESHGFDEGSQFLSMVAHTIQYTFKEDPVAHFSDDHFVVFAKDDEKLSEKLTSIRRKIIQADESIKLGLKVGSYAPEDLSCLTTTACDFARYACDTLKKKYDTDYCEYTSASAEDFARKQYIINNIDKAIEQGYIHIYYQPVVFAENKELCGFEALARWIDPRYGFMPPKVFIGVLEEYRQIHKLDAYIVKEVSNDIKETPSRELPLLPISINFSRLDFELMDIESLLEENIEKKGIDKKYIHIEVTESALSENDKKLQTVLRNLKDKNYSLWLDDFGSGYSGLNILKEYSFDMMKIDMAFLHNFSETPKSKPILKNIVRLANDIGMKTLTEGVETEDAFEFLRSIGCERIQGYLFGKPMPKEEIIQKLKNGDFNISSSNSLLE